MVISWHPDLVTFAAEPLDFVSEDYIYDMASEPSMEELSDANQLEGEGGQDDLGQSFRNEGIGEEECARLGSSSGSLDQPFDEANPGEGVEDLGGGSYNLEMCVRHFLLLCVTLYTTVCCATYVSFWLYTHSLPLSSRLHSTHSLTHSSQGGLLRDGRWRLWGLYQRWNTRAREFILFSIHSTERPERTRLGEL